MLLNGDVKRNIAGQVTANGTTAVSITLNGLEANSVVLVSLNTVGGTPAGAPYVFSKDTATGVVEFKSVSGDTSVYDVIYFK